MSYPGDRSCNRTSGGWVGLLLRWIVCIASLSEVFAADSSSVQVKVDQVGYLPTSTKLALVTAQANTFEVKRVSDNGTVFKGELSPVSLDADTQDSIQTADSSKLKKSGTYYLDVPGGA